MRGLGASCWIVGGWSCEIIKIFFDYIEKAGCVYIAPFLWNQSGSVSCLQDYNRKSGMCLYLAFFVEPAYWVLGKLAIKKARRLRLAFL